MASKKVTITLPEELVRELSDLAGRAGVPLSRLIAEAAARDLRQREGQDALAAWQAENGQFTAAEMAAARAEAASVDAALMAQLDRARGAA